MQWHLAIVEHSELNWWLYVDNAHKLEAIGFLLLPRFRQLCCERAARLGHAAPFGRAARLGFAFAIWHETEKKSFAMQSALHMRPLGLFIIRCNLSFYIQYDMCTKISNIKSTAILIIYMQCQTLTMKLRTFAVGRVLQVLNVFRSLLSLLVFSELWKSTFSSSTLPYWFTYVVLFMCCLEPRGFTNGFTQLQSSCAHSSMVEQFNKV